MRFPWKPIHQIECSKLKYYKEMESLTIKQKKLIVNILNRSELIAFYLNWLLLLFNIYPIFYIF